MVQVLPASNKWATAGNNFGQGFGDQIPKEADRYRLSQGLQNIKNNPNMSNTDRLMALYTTPGVTNEMVQTLAPLLNQEAVKNNRQNRGGQQTSPRQPQNGGAPSSIQNPNQMKPSQGQVQPNVIQGQPTPQDQINARNLNQANINPQTMQPEQP